MLRIRFTVLTCSCAVALLAAGGSASAFTPGPARYTSFPVTGATTPSALASTVPRWSRSIVSAVDNKTYNYVIVGRNPYTAASGSAAINTDVVQVKLEFLNASNVVQFTYDPDAPNPACGLSTSPDARVLGSPLFQVRQYNVDGTSIGDVQYEDEFMREEFASQVFGSSAPNPNYGIVLNAINRPEITVKVPAADWATGSACGGTANALGAIELSYWDSLLRGTLIPQLQAAGETAPTHFLAVLFGNVVMYQGKTTNCCVLGYHSGVNTTAGVQYYSTSDYDSSGVFTGSGDISGMSHEFGEWLNDPNGNNPTPLWGHIGQVTGCQGNLEVGDPLSGTLHAVTMTNGITYHEQELAFFSWFYRQSPSIGLGGWYSNFGKFRHSAGAVCS